MLGTALGLVAVVVCVALNAFFVAAEFALVTVRHTWVEQLAKKGHKSIGYVKQAAGRLDDTIAATQLGITIASIALGWLGEPAIARLIEPVFARFTSASSTAAHTVATAVAFSAITFLHVVLGELAPKAIALGNPEETALRVARPLLYFSRAFRPIVWAMNGVGNAIVRRLGFEPASGHERAHSAAELKMLVDESHDAGGLDVMQAEVVGRTLELGQIRVREVMTSIDGVAFLDLTMADQEILAAITLTEFTRMPVWSGRRGKFIGVANVKLLLLQHLRTGKLRLRDAILQPLTFHHAAPLGRVLRQFKKRGQHLGFVASDDGAQIGIVTMEDVIEQMLGDIDDELDVGADSVRMSRASIERAERPSIH